MHEIAVRGCRAALVVAASLTLTAGSGKAQVPDLRQQTTFGIGYTASLPDALAGVGVWQKFGSSRIGIFADAKVTLPSLRKHANYCPAALGSCDVTWVRRNRNDFHLGTEEQWLLINAGGMYVLSSQFAVMLGAGMARRNTYQEFVDDSDVPEGRITWEGNYFVPDGSEWEPQAVASVLMRIASRVAFTFGIESATRAMAVGAYLVLP